MSRRKDLWRNAKASMRRKTKLTVRPATRKGMRTQKDMTRGRNLIVLLRSWKTDSLGPQPCVASGKTPRETRQLLSKERVDIIDCFRGCDMFFPDAECFSAPTTPGFSTNARALHVPAEELTMWVGVKPAFTNSAAATA